MSRIDADLRVAIEAVGRCVGCLGQYIQVAVPTVMATRAIKTRPIQTALPTAIAASPARCVPVAPFHFSDNVG